MGVSEKSPNPPGGAGVVGEKSMGVMALNEVGVSTSSAPAAGVQVAAVEIPLLMVCAKARGAEGC